MPAPACAWSKRRLRAVLQLETLHTHGYRAWRGYPQSFGGGPFDVARVIFRYADAEIRPDEKRIHHPARRRNGPPEAPPDAEAAALEGAGRQRPAENPRTRCTPSAARRKASMAWPAKAPGCRFMQEDLERLKQAGWQIEFPEDFRHHVLEVDGWEADLIESDNGWFDLDMGIMVEGERLPLAPLLAGLFRSDAALAGSRPNSSAFPDDEGIELHTARGKRLRVPAGRIKPLAATLIDLFDGFTGGDTLRLSRFDAPRLAELSDTSRWQFRGQSDIMALAERLRARRASPRCRAAGRPLPGTAPLSERRPGLAAVPARTEPVRHPGRRHGPRQDGADAGPPAAGKGSRPPRQAGLIILPTSLIFNWKNEAARFAPDLKVLSLHGPERKSRFAEIPEHDVVLTTYPLLWRDADELMQHSYHLLILDEAQTVKNAQSQQRRSGAQDRRPASPVPDRHAAGKPPRRIVEPVRLPAARLSRHQQAVHQTLADADRKAGRQPAQPAGPPHPPLHPAPQEGRRGAGTAAEDHHRAQRRTRRRPARPLRNRACRDGRQGARRDRQQGLRRSQIVILDALLKLRQVCCDPRLVKAAAKQGPERAKLDLLMAMLPELVDEGRASWSSRNSPACWR
jgi:hypothetical protein